MSHGHAWAIGVMVSCKNWTSEIQIKLFLMIYRCMVRHQLYMVIYPMTILNTARVYGLTESLPTCRKVETLRLRQ